MATQEIMTDNQPVEKDSQLIENEILSLEIRENIRRGVLNGLITKHEVTSYTNSKAKTDENNRYGVMQLIPNNFLVLPHMFSKEIVDENMNLAYSKKSNFIYTLIVCEQIGSNNTTKFLYSWKKWGRYYVAAPYYVKSSEKESEIMCSKPLDITKAVLGKKIKEISKRMKRLTNSSNSKKGFNRKMYKWCKDGSDNNFTVSNIEKTPVYWKAGGTNEESVGKMVQIHERDRSQKARLQFLQH